MSDTVKLIIEIPKEDIELICKTSFVEDERTMFKQSPSDRQGTLMLFRLTDSVKNGTPLDDVKETIEQDMSFDMFDDYGNKTRIHKELWEILDNIGKESEEEE